MSAPQRGCEKCGAAYGPEVVFCPTDGAPVSNRGRTRSADPYLGRVVRREFRLEQLLGVGAMGRVYRAHQLFVERPVAVKILHAELLGDAALVARFQREAQATARIRSPHVISVVSAGVLEPDGGSPGGEPYLVLEYLDGLSLRSLLSASGVLPLSRALDIVLGCAAAIAEAHHLGIVHRDLKPENVMLVRAGGRDDFVKVLDFGMARFEPGSSEFRTRAGAVLGTARYISPEGARGETVGPAADVYSLATLLFECLAGETPFAGPNAVAILLRQAAEAPPDVRSLPRAASVPAPLGAFLARCLAKAPQDRPENGSAFCRELVNAARESGIDLAALPSLPTELKVAKTLKLPVAPAEPAHSAAPPAALTPPTHAISSRKHAASTLLRRIGWVAGCFVLGALGALLIARQLGAFGAPGAVDSHGSRGPAP